MSLRSAPRNLRTYHRLFGRRGLLLPARTRLSFLPTEFKVQPDGLEHPVSLRAGTSDIATFKQVLSDHQYELDLAFTPATIVDAGANIGLTSVYFASRYPNARVLAIEPDSSNFELLQRNIAPYPRVVAIRAALWGNETALRIVDPGIGAWAFQTREEPGIDSEEVRGEVMAVTLPRLMQRYGFESIDLLKIDIEGAEKQVFDTAGPWVDTVQVIIAELHDWATPGATESFDAAAAGFDSRWHRGEHRIAARGGCLHPTAGLLRDETARRGGVEA